MALISVWKKSLMSFMIRLSSVGEISEVGNEKFILVFISEVDISRKWVEFVKTI